MFDWTSYSNLTHLQINVDTILFFFSFDSFFDKIHTVIGVTRDMHNSLTHRSQSPSKPQEEFLLKNTQVKRPFRVLYKSQVYPFYTTQHNNTTSPKIERQREKTSLTHWKSDLIKLHFNLVPRSTFKNIGLKRMS